MRVLGPMPLYLVEPPEPCELPLLRSRRKGVDGVLGPLSVDRSCEDTADVLSILPLPPCNSKHLHMINLNSLMWAVDSFQT